MKTNSRYIAFEILKKVFKNQAFSNILLNEVATKDIPQKFKNLIFALVSGTIANKIFLEKTTNKIIDAKRTSFDIQILLWMGFYQIRFLKNIPQYAIVNESVSIAKLINPKLSGLVNACLKKCISNEETLFDYSNLENEDKICTINSFPKNLFQLIKNQFGLDYATKIAQDSLSKPVVSFRVNNIKISTEKFYALYKESNKLSKTNVDNCLISSNAIVDSPLYKDGLITIQDPASIMVVNILNPTPNSNVLDMCAAPGGKTTHISMLMNNTGKIVAYEINKNKLELINQNARRLGCKNIELNCGDSTSINFEQKFDYILLDAPCSGFGVMKRKPEIKINDFNKNKIKEIIKTQKQLLDSAYQNLKTNGILVYSTCTINKEENQNQIAEFLKNHNDMKIVSENQIFGYENNTDGFYICKILKN